ncbi:hypothetical protein EJB05_20120, partial [Eragrostis curvula]
MASSLVLVVAMVLSLAQLSVGSRRLMELYIPKPSEQVTYHPGGTVLSGDIPVSFFWYGKFTPAQKSILSDFFLLLTAAPNAATPSVQQWWGTIEQLYLSNAAATANGATATRVLLDQQVSDEACSLGKSLTLSQIEQLAARVGGKKGGIALVFTDEDVAVEGFCSSRCGKHGSAPGGGSTYIWVGNSVKQCPGHCAWPFAQPEYGPQGAPLVAPNGDVGVDGMVMVAATMLAGTVTNPYGDAFYQGAKEAPLEASTACPGVYGSGAYPGYPGNLLVDPTTGASYNANGANGRKYLVPAIYNPATASCSTLV